MSHHQHDKNSYYLPAPSHWPIVATIALFLTLGGAANWLHGKVFGPYMMMTGLLCFFFMLFGWFGTVIRENRAGLYNNAQVDRSFRWGMAWFIFSEVMFFGVFFGALYYTHALVVPWLGGEGTGMMTHILLWPNFHAVWPVLTTPDPNAFQGPKGVMEIWHIPLANTLILLTSGVTVTIAHFGILKGNRKQMLIGQIMTIILGISFLSMQAHEYLIAYTEKALKLSAGIYGTTFFMLTGFHAAHVTIGTTMLCVILYRMFRGDFTKENHFAFEAVSWYWHFVDVVWLLLFVFVYWM